MGGVLCLSKIFPNVISLRDLKFLTLKPSMRAINPLFYIFPFISYALKSLKNQFLFKIQHSLYFALISDSETGTLHSESGNISC